MLIQPKGNPGQMWGIWLYAGFFFNQNPFHGAKKCLKSSHLGGLSVGHGQLTVHKGYQAWSFPLKLFKSILVNNIDTGHNSQGGGGGGDRKIDNLSAPSTQKPHPPWLTLGLTLKGALESGQVFEWLCPMTWFIHENKQNHHPLKSEP